MSFVSVPLTVDYLGTERYGVWLTISSLLLWLALTDFGVAGNALVNVLSEAVGNDDREAARHYTASAFWTLVAIALVLGVVFAGTFQLIPWRAVFRVSDATSTHELKVTCALVLGLLVINLPLGLLRSLFHAHQDGYFANAWSIVSGIASLLGLVVVTRFHGGLPQLVLAVSGVPALVLLASAYYTFGRRYPWLAPAPSTVKWSCIQRLLKLGVKYMTMQLASLGIYQSQAILTTQTLGPSQVVVFVVAFKIMNLPSELVYMGTAPLISAFGEAKARRVGMDQRRLQKWYVCRDRLRHTSRGGAGPRCETLDTHLGWLLCRARSLSDPLAVYPYRGRSVVLDGCPVALRHRTCWATRALQCPLRSRLHQIRCRLCAMVGFERHRICYVA